jgi:hypothetical protein
MVALWCVDSSQRHTWSKGHARMGAPALAGVAGCEGARDAPGGTLAWRRYIVRRGEMSSSGAIDRPRPAACRARHTCDAQPSVSLSMPWHRYCVSDAKKGYYSE